jgi:hypothetical protein
MAMVKYQSIIDKFRNENLIDEDVYGILKTLTEKQIKYAEFPKGMNSLIQSGLTEPQLLELQTSTLLCSMEVSDTEVFKDLYKKLKEHYFIT